MRAIKKIPYKFVHVIWIDIVSDSAWRSIEDVKESKLPRCLSTGFLVSEEKDVVRHSLVRRLLKRYHDSFNIIDDVSAEKTISMWVHDEGMESPPDGSGFYEKETTFQLKQ